MLVTACDARDLVASAVLCHGCSLIKAVLSRQPSQLHLMQGGVAHYSVVEQLPYLPGAATHHG